jgi:hypothetical protein
MRILVTLLTSLLVIAMAVAGCGGDATSDGSRGSSKPAAAPGSKSHTAQAARRRIDGSVARAGAGNVASCLADAGFASAPPSHGVSEQWSAEDGTVVAHSTDPGQADSTASEVGGKVVGSSGYVIAGTGALASAARTCVQRAEP